MNEKNHECAYCGATFMQETRYLKHKCEKMRRFEESRTSLGQGAFSLYQKWFTLKKKVAPSAEAFINSKQYKPFIRFAEFIKRARIGEPELYIRMMNELGVLPAHWTGNEMYARYLEYLDRKISPLQHANITMKTLDRIADAAECDVSEVFDVLLPNEVIQLIRERKLSPWILLRSRKFMVFFELMSVEEQQILETLVRLEYWKKKFLNNPTDKSLMDDIVVELGI